MNNNNTPWKIIDCRERFVNALEESLLYPEFHFWHEDMNRIGPDREVKVCCNGERFWTKVVQVDGENILALVRNDLLFNDDLHVNALVWFTKEHIYSTNIPLWTTITNHFQPRPYWNMII